MWKTVATAAAVLLIGGAALAQSTGTSQPRRTNQPAGTVGRPVVPIPPGESAADLSRRGRGLSDLNNNSATEGPGTPSGSTGSTPGTGSAPAPGSDEFEGMPDGTRYRQVPPRR